MDNRISMDETFVFLRKGSERRGSRGTVDPEDVLCTLPKPTYNCLFITTIIQLIIIIAGCITFGPLGYKTCSLIVSCDCTDVDKISTINTRSSKELIDTTSESNKWIQRSKETTNLESRIKGKQIQLHKFP